MNIKWFIHKYNFFFLNPVERWKHICESIAITKTYWPLSEPTLQSFTFAANWLVFFNKSVQYSFYWREIRTIDFWWSHKTILFCPESLIHVDPFLEVFMWSPWTYFSKKNIDHIGKSTKKRKCVLMNDVDRTFLYKSIQLPNSLIKLKSDYFHKIGILWFISSLNLRRWRSTLTYIFVGF